MGEEATATLVQQARGGSARAYEVLVRRHLRAAYAVALAVLKVPAEAEDVAQEALVVAWEQLSECRQPEAFSGWLVNIARNQARNALARRKVRSDFAAKPPGDDAPGEPVTAAVDAREQLLRALEALDERQREVVLLHDLEGWSHAEIGEALALSEVNSRQLLFSARKAMRAALSPQEPGHE